MSLTKLPLGRNNSVMTSLFPPRESLVLTSRLGTGNLRTFFYGVSALVYMVMVYNKAFSLGGMSPSLVYICPCLWLYVSVLCLWSPEHVSGLYMSLSLAVCLCSLSVVYCTMYMSMVYICPCLWLYVSVLCLWSTVQCTIFCTCLWSIYVPVYGSMSLFSVSGLLYMPTVYIQQSASVLLNRLK